VLIITLQKRPLRGLFLFLLLSEIILTNQKIKINNIEIQGNTKTLNYIIQREINHHISSPLDSIMAEEDRARIENLGIFSEVTWEVIPIDNVNAKLVYKVIESIQNIPPTILPAYDEKTGWSVVGAFLMTNWRGRNQSLSFNASFGGKDTYGIIFNDPWSFGNHVSMKIQIDKSIYKHNFLEYNIEKDIMRIDFGRWFGQFIKTKIGFSLESTEFNNEDNNNIKYNYFSIKPVFKYDTRDIYWNPKKGILWSNFYDFKKNIIQKKFINFFWKNSLSFYKELFNSNKKLILAVNTTYKFLWGDKDVTWLNYMGDSYTVRGWKLPNQNLYNSNSQKFRFGYDLIHGSLELRKEIIPKFITNYGTEFGLLGVMFIDVGIISDKYIDLNKNPKMFGSGFGIRIPIPLIHLIRIDYGWGYRNQKWNSGSLHWGILHKF